jgi:hypothetical protein
MQSAVFKNLAIPLKVATECKMAIKMAIKVAIKMAIKMAILILKDHEY